MSHCVLVVDDDPDIRDTVIEILEERGHEAVGVANGNEALATLQKLDEDPCLILLDLMMPGMDGRTFREAQLQDPKLAAIPVVVVSAFRDVETTATELGVAGHVKKPVSLKELMEVIEKFCPPAS